MVEDSAKEDWVRVLTERPPDCEGEPWTVHCVGERRFTLLELVASEETDLTPDNRVAVDGEDIINMYIQLTYHAFIQAAQDRLKETIAAIIEAHEQRFIDWYNIAQPVSASTNSTWCQRPVTHAAKRLSPSAGRSSFADFAALETRGENRYDPQAVLVERALTELVEVEDARYKLLVN
jgi:putative nucleotide binding protein